MRNTEQPCVEHASISWDSKGYPHSESFEDVYYSKIDGQEESKYVFLEANQLSKRWSELTPEDNFTFVIAETGFGTGLNFLNAWQLWDTLSDKHNCNLHFLSIEKFPLKQEDLVRAHQLWPTLSAYSERLTKQTPLPLKGNHRLNLTNRVTLTLIYGDVITALGSNIFKAHCWFLDGFAPSKNPDMWNEALFSLIAQRCFNQATLSTFTAVGAIRRSLISHGFDMKKIQGFGAKREMLTGVFQDTNKGVSANKLYQRFDISKPWFLDKHRCKHDKYDFNNLTVTVVGAGLAGCWTAYRLAERGAQVNIIEKGPAPGFAASGNPLGALYVKPGIDYSKETKLSLLATEYAKQSLDRLQGYDTQEIFWENCGVLQLIQNAKDRDYADKLISQNNYPEEVVTRLDRHLVSEKAGVQIEQDALFFEISGKAYPKRLCRHLLQHKNITAYFNTALINAEFNNENNCWILKTTPVIKRSETNILILATANDTLAFEHTKHLPIKPIKGQITIAQLNKHEDKLRTVVCGDSYAAYDQSLGLCFGASFKLGEDSNESTEEEQISNIENLEKISTCLNNKVKALTKESITNRSSTRTSTPDYQPIVGPVADHKQLLQDFAKLRKDAKAKFVNTASYLPNLYVNTGHGSKGLTTTPIAAELICDYIYGTPFALDNYLIEALHPTRFAIRAMIRNKE